MPRPNRPSAGRPSRVRIIGGRWRGRHLPVAEAAGLRPTKDRIRETLFNWLQPVVEGGCCLDAFAGTGALGFEAASRGAGTVLMLDRDSALCRGLQAQARRLEADNVEVLCADALRYLSGGARAPAPFDIVFLDPPFGAGLLADSCRALAANGWLRPGARIYLESARHADWPDLPPGWQWLRQNRAGDVAYGLAVAGE